MAGKADGSADTRPRKMARRSGPAEEEAASPTRSAMEMAAFVRQLQHYQSSPIAWSCHNIVAVPTPACPPAPSLLGPPTTINVSAPPTVTIMHFSGTTAAPLPRLTKQLALPPSASSPTSSVSHLSFSPDGCQLLVVTSSDMDEVMTVLEQQDGCVDSWEAVWSERVARFGEDSSASASVSATRDRSNVKRFVNCRWLGEPRRWCAASQTAETPQSARPLYCAPVRSPPLQGSAFVVVLSSNELLFVHLPRNVPLVPLTIVLPLRPHTSEVPLSLTATPTSSTLAAQSLNNDTGIAASPANPLDALVANLVDGMPSNGPSPGAIVGALGLGVPTDGAFNAAGEAMKQELKAAEAVKGAAHAGDKRFSVAKAAVGVTRAERVSECGESLFLIATSLAPRPRPPPPPPKAFIPPTVLAAAANLDMTDLITGNTAVSSPDEFSTDFADFSALDEAFGGASTAAPNSPAPNSDDKGEESDDDDSERIWGLNKPRPSRVELSEIRIEMMCQDGPRLSVRPLAPLHLTDGLDETDRAESTALTHLEWLEDVQIPKAGSPAGSEPSVDLRLLAVTASSAAGQTAYRSRATSWALSNEPYQLTEAFAGLDCKKSDVTTGEREWATRKVASFPFDGLLTSVWPKCSPEIGMLTVAEATLGTDGALASTVKVLDASTLEKVSRVGTSTLPGQRLYSSAVPSPNHSLICAIPMYTLDTRANFTLSTVPLGTASDSLPATLSFRLARAIAMQADCSDILGRINGLENDQDTLAVSSQVRSHLQSMLPSGRKLEQSGLLLEMLGPIAALYSSNPSLLLRGRVASDFLKLATVVRAFKKSEKKERASPEAGFRCESDAVWPLIAHASWYTDYSRELAQELAAGSSSESSPSPRFTLLLHPVGRSLLAQAAECILGLQAFLAGFPPHQNVTVDTAKTVLDDVVDYSGLVLREWTSILAKIGELPGLSGESPETQDLLVSFEPSAHSTTAIPGIVSLLSTPSLFLPSTMPTPPPTPLPRPSQLDIIRRSRLADQGSFKRCLRCGERAEKRPLLGTESGKWAAYEIGWESRCLCGGLWYSETRV